MPRDRANLMVSWKAVAIGATTVALAALTGLAVVATIKNADTLSVVALAVAIVAFVVQILVFIVQAAAASQQDLRAQELYGSTMSILSTIEEKAEGTRRDVSTINEKMLEAILGKAISETAISTSPGSADFGEIVAERAARLVGPSVMVTEHEVSKTIPRFGSELYAEFPERSGVQRVLPKIKDLDPNELMILAILGRDEVQFIHGNRPYAGLRIPDPDKLLEAGLIREGKARGTGDRIYVLTDDGMIAARILLAADVPSSEMASVAGIRKSVRDLDRRAGSIGRVFDEESLDEASVN